MCLEGKPWMRSSCTLLILAPVVPDISYAPLPPILLFVCSALALLVLSVCPSLPLSSFRYPSRVPFSFSLSRSPPLNLLPSPPLRDEQTMRHPRPATQPVRVGWGRLSRELPQVSRRPGRRSIDCARDRGLGRSGGVGGERLQGRQKGVRRQRHPEVIIALSGRLLAFLAPVFFFSALLLFFFFLLSFFFCRVCVAGHWRVLRLRRSFGFCSPGLWWCHGEWRIVYFEGPGRQQLTSPVVS